MPLFVRVSPPEPGKKEVYGPYTEDRFLHVANFARISSKRSKVSKTREVIWVCGKRKPSIVQVYQDGVCVFPKGKAGDRKGEVFTSLKTCMATAGEACKVDNDEKPENLIKGRHREVRPACPTKLSAKKQ